MLQRHIQDSPKHLRRSVFQQCLASFSGLQLFLSRSPWQMFLAVLDMPLCCPRQVSQMNHSFLRIGMRLALLLNKEKTKKYFYCLKHQICTTKKFSYTSITNEIASLERHAKNLFQTIQLQNNYNILCCGKFLSIT